MRKPCSPDVVPSCFQNPSNLLFWQCLAGPCVCLPMKCLSVASSNFNKFFDDSPPFTGKKKTPHIYHPVSKLILFNFSIYFVLYSSWKLWTKPEKKFFFQSYLPPECLCFSHFLFDWVLLVLTVSLLTWNLPQREPEWGIAGLGWPIGMSVGYYLISCGWHHPLDSAQNCIGQEKAKSKQAGRLDAFISFWPALWLWCEQLPWLSQNEELSPGIESPKKTLSLLLKCFDRSVVSQQQKLSWKHLFWYKYLFTRVLLTFSSLLEMKRHRTYEASSLPLSGTNNWYSRRTNFFFLIKDY